MGYKLASLEVVFTPIYADVEMSDLRLLAGSLAGRFDFRAAPSDLN
jgi:hypothetical protein